MIVLVPYYATVLHCGSTALSICSTAASFQIFLVSMFISLMFGMSLTFLLNLLSAILIAVAFCHLATKSLFYFAESVHNGNLILSPTVSTW